LIGAEMILKIDHVGIVVDSSQEMVEGFARLFEFSDVSTIEEAGQGLLSRLICANGAGLEVISPTGPEGGIARFLHRKGGGVHHLSFQVDKI
jgi:methylmalonyl-CoA/ethylmalonyl-CoA epimerase